MNAMYGEGSYRRAQQLINELAPGTRRDNWWASPGPYEICARHIMRGRIKSITAFVACGDCCTHSLCMADGTCRAGILRSMPQ